MRLEKASSRRHTTMTTAILVLYILANSMDRGVSFLSPYRRHDHQLQYQPCLSSASRTVPSSALFSTTSPKSSSSSQQPGRPRSRVSDPSGATPPLVEIEYPKVKMEDMPERQYDKYVHPIPHQPWRRGEMAGCNDPIDAAWRKEAERRIKFAVELNGGSFVDVTWYLTFVVVTIGGDVASKAKGPRDYGPATGPAIRWNKPQREDENIFIDPNDPKPEPIWNLEELNNKYLYDRDANWEEEDRIKRQTYAQPDKEDVREKKRLAKEAAEAQGLTVEDEEEEEDKMKANYKDLGLDPEELDEPPLRVKEEFREDYLHGLYVRKQLDDEFYPKDVDMKELKLHTLINTDALSAIGGAIYDALQEVEGELRVLARHEVVLSAEGLGSVVETQKRFDAKRGCKVAVHTQDPWQSNRILKGILLDRNALDVYIKKQGRMVTIPNNFVKYVELVDPADHEPNPDYLTPFDFKRMMKEKKNEPKLFVEEEEEEEEEEDIYEDDD